MTGIHVKMRKNDVNFSMLVGPFKQTGVEGVQQAEVSHWKCENESMSVTGF